MASKRVAEFATKFQNSQHRQGKSLRTSDDSTVEYIPVFSTEYLKEEYDETVLPEYNRGEETYGDVKYLTAFKLGVNA